MPTPDEMRQLRNQAEQRRRRKERLAREIAAIHEQVLMDTIWRDLIAAHKEATDADT